uniref:Putative C1q domain containing protein MgC1q29 n=1 Tax=Mytilus galloprovincialis TaxID=29158 RepID=F0V466_MYTGA|nr:putative C1q domain containing protein MgC1q29 [Mytilus galloprovincialis]
MAYLECLLFVVGLTICSGRVTGPPQNDRSGKHGTIAFSVGLTSTLHMSYSETIIYDKVFSNFGDGYSVDTGEFTAPDTGVYVFHAHAYNSNQDRAMWIELIKNIDSLVSVSGYNSHSTAGNTVIVSLHKGETVAVRARPGQEFTLFGKSDQVYTTFSGYRIGEIPYSDPAAGLLGR